MAMPKNTYACDHWCTHLAGAIRGCTSEDFARDMLGILQMFTRCDALEVWINIEIAGYNTDGTLRHLRDIQLLLQVQLIPLNFLTDALILCSKSEPILLSDKTTVTICEIEDCLKVHFHVEFHFDFWLRSLHSRMYITSHHLN